MKWSYALLLPAAVLVLLAFALMAVPGFRFSITLCFAFAALLLLMFFLLKHPAGKLVCKVICIFLLLGALAAGITLAFIVSAAHPAEIPSCSHIIVLGAGVRGTVPSLTLRERINAAYAYLTAHPEAIAVLSGGQGPDEEITEAACMYRELTEMGIDGSRLLQEDRSTSTIENLNYSMELIEAAAGSRPEQIGIVSNEYHIFRANAFARTLGMKPVGIPAQTSWVSLRINYYLREIAAVWKYLLLGL